MLGNLAGMLLLMFGARATRPKGTICMRTSLEWLESRELAENSQEHGLRHRREPGGIGHKGLFSAMGEQAWVPERA